ncbi:MAG: hypothetical protein ABI833_00155 [Acidobacteriota bacterium]
MKNYLKRIALVAVVGLAGAGIVAADQWDKKTIITTDETMQLPNMTLQPGTYVIKLASSQANRHIVQFFDKDERHLVTTVLAIPNERLQPTGKSVFAFWEVPAGQPKALRAWFYPGDNFGQEFAYPKTEASQIMATNAGANVPINDEKSADLDASATDKDKDNDNARNKETTTSVAVAEPTRAPASVETTTQTAQERAPSDIAQAQQAPPPPALTQDRQYAAPVDNSDRGGTQRLTAQTTTPESLPATASNLPLFALIGLLSIACAVALKFADHRS